MDPQYPDDWIVPDDLSSLLDGDLGTTPLPSQSGEDGQGAIAVIPGIDILPGSPYIAQVQASDDVVIELPYDRAVAYAMAVLNAAHRAHYLAAVTAQSWHVVTKHKEHEEAEEHVRVMLSELIKDLPELDDSDTAPLRFRPGIRKSGKPAIRVTLPPHTEALTVWEFAETCEHAHHVLDAALVSNLDTAYRNDLTVNFQLDEQTARAAVEDLANYYDNLHYAKAAPPVKVRPPTPGPKPPGNSKKRRKR